LSFCVIGVLRNTNQQGANQIASHFGIHESNVFLLHFFVLIQRNEAKKNQGKPDRSARFAL
jgi:hypothetical protein